MKHISLLSIISGSVLAVHGVNVDCRPGLLGSKIDNPASVSELAISGSVDASDLYFIADSMPSLRSLDMSAVKIESYAGSPIGSFSSYEEDEIPAAIFAGSNYMKVLLPKNCSLGSFSFSGSKIKEIYLPAGTTIGDGAFSCCRHLTVVKTGSDVTLGHSAFRDCDMLRIVEGSENIKLISPHAFDGCALLDKFTFGSELESIGESAFAGCGVKEADMSACSKLENIGAWAFAGSASLESAVLPSGLERIGVGIFFECSSLADITLPKEMKELPPYALKDAAVMNTIFVLPGNTVAIGEYAMLGASSVLTIELPASLKSIGDGAMEEMTSLASIDAKALTAVPELGDNVWSSVNQKNVVLEVSPSLHTVFENTPQWQEFDISSSSQSSLDSTIMDKKCLRVAFDGSLLMVESIGASIEEINVCDLGGTVLFNKRGLKNEIMKIETRHSSSAVYIIECSLTDGTRRSVKILRR